jgi:hypothetical protein
MRGPIARNVRLDFNDPAGGATARGFAHKDAADQRFRERDRLRRKFVGSKPAQVYGLED